MNEDHELDPKEKEDKKPDEVHPEDDHISSRPKEKQDEEVDEQGEESFPASDPPANY